MRARAVLVVTLAVDDQLREDPFKTSDDRIDAGPAATAPHEISNNVRFNVIDCRGNDISVVLDDLSQTGLPADIFGRKDRQLVVKGDLPVAALT
jgi:hypothetical protein